MLKEIGVAQRLDGWKHLINDICLNNELTDVKNINIPNLLSEKIDQQEWYTFAEFLPPGYHQILIYDPKLERAFIKDIIINLNQRDFVYPECPQAASNIFRNNVSDMWREWKEDTPKKIKEIIKKDGGEEGEL